MKEIKCTYVFVKSDELELPIAVADTLDEIVGLTGFNWSLLQRACLRNSLIAGKYRIRKVDIREDEQKFNDVSDYKKFCVLEAIPENDFKSLQRYRQYCFGAWDMEEKIKVKVFHGKNKINEAEFKIYDKALDFAKKHVAVGYACQILRLYDGKLCCKVGLYKPETM